MTYAHETQARNNIAAVKAGVTKTTTIPVVKEKTEEQLNLERIVAAQITERLFAPVSHASITKSVAYVTAANGLFKVTKTPIAIYKEQLETFTTEVIGLPKMEAGVELAIPKIPMHKIVEVLSWYRDVNTADRTEASVLFFWNYNDVALPDLPGLSAEGKLVTYCPIQVNSGALSNFTMDTNVTWMRQNLALLLETHSHNTMGAFFSGTDDANENMTQFYGVWGKVTDALPMWAFRYVVGKSKVQCDPSILIDWPTAKVQETIIRSSSMVLSGETDVLDLEITGAAIEQASSPVTTQKEERVIAGPFKMLPYPADWMAQHSKPKYPAYTPATYYGGGKNYGGRPTGSQVDTYGQTSLTDFYDEEYQWKTGKQVGGASQKKWESAAASGARNSYEPQLLALDDFEERVSECVEVSTEKGAPSKELASFGEKVAQKLVVDGNSIGYFYK